jgi:nitroreductase
MRIVAGGNDEEGVLEACFNTEFETLMRTRYSCRAYLPQPIPPAKMSQLLEVAQRTPSWCNTQPWKVIITSGEGTDRFRSALLAQVKNAGHESDFDFPREYSGVYLDRRRACGQQLYDSLGIGRQDREARTAQALENFRFFGAPHVAIITSPEPLGTYGAVDCGAYVNSFMLAAHSLGLASVAQAALALQSKFIREYFDLGNDLRVVCGISFGYADRGHPVNGFRTSRVNFDAAVTWISE